MFDRFCSVFTEEQYQTALHDGEVPHLVGNSFDELMRHTPSLKPQVMAAVVKMLQTVVEMGKSMHIEDEGGNINLMVSKGSPETAASVDSTATPVFTDASGDVTMTDVSASTSMGDAVVSGVRDDTAAIKEATRDSKVSQFIETISRVCISFHSSLDVVDETLIYPKFNSLLRVFCRLRSMVQSSSNWEHCQLF